MILPRPTGMRIGAPSKKFSKDLTNAPVCAIMRHVTGAVSRAKGAAMEKEQSIDRVDQDVEERREAYKRREREAIAEMSGETAEEPEESKEKEQEE